MVGDHGGLHSGSFSPPCSHRVRFAVSLRMAVTKEPIEIGELYEIVLTGFWRKRVMLNDKSTLLGEGDIFVAKNESELADTC